MANTVINQNKNKRHFYKNKRRQNRFRIRRGVDPLLDRINVQFCQINLGKRHEAMTNLNQKTSQGRFIALMQEPNISTARGMNKVSGLDSQHAIYHTNSPNCRAAIYAHREIPLWMNHDLSDNDNAACLWVTKNITASRVLVISSYWDRFVLESPQILTKALNYASANNFEVLIGADTNAHSVLTGSDSTDARSQILENFIFKHNLDIVNHGSEHTFESHVGKSCIDVTLATPNLASQIRNWKVDKTDNHSGHHTLTFGISTPQPQTELKRNFAKLDLNQLKVRLEEETANWNQPEWWDKSTIEDQERLGDSILQKVLDELAPLIPTKITPTWLTWWTEELQQMKDKLRKWYRMSTGRNPSDYIRHKYNELFHKYKKAVRKAKKDSWKRFCDSTESTSEMARLAKIMRYHPKFSLGLIRNPNGNMSSTPEESLELLTNATFPGSV